MRIFASPALHCRYWDDEAVVYDARQARTHLLSSLSAQVLAQLMSSSEGATLVELENQLQTHDADVTVALSDAERDVLRRAIDELSQLGLLELRTS